MNPRPWLVSQNIAEPALMRVVIDWTGWRLAQNSIATFLDRRETFQRTIRAQIGRFPNHDILSNCGPVRKFVIY
jgi:hypothetical protein